MTAKEKTFAVHDTSSSSDDDEPQSSQKCRTHWITIQLIPSVKERPIRLGESFFFFFWQL